MSDQSDAQHLALLEAGEVPDGLTLEAFRALQPHLSPRMQMEAELNFIVSTGIPTVALISQAEMEEIAAAKPAEEAAEFRRVYQVLTEIGTSLDPKNEQEPEDQIH